MLLRPVIVRLSPQVASSRPLRKNGIISQLTRVLVGLYEEPERPANARGPSTVVKLPIRKTRETGVIACTNKWCDYLMHMDACSDLLSMKVRLRSDST